MIYDYIVIGAGMGGLSAGLNLALNNKKVLMLEKNSLPGGLTSTFKRGRFEFDTSLYELYNYGNDEHIGDIQEIFQKYALNIPTTLISFNSRIKIESSKEEYEINGNFENFVVLLEELTPNSIDSVREFIKITKEIHETLKEIEEGKEPNKETSSSFYKYLSKSTFEGLKDLKMPDATIHRLCYLWTEIGSPINKLSFIDFAEFMYKIIFKKIVIINNKSLDFAIKLVKKYQSKGGKLYYNSCVTSISDEDNLKIVTTSDGTIYKAKEVICDLSKRYVLKELLKEPLLNANKLENARTLSPNGLIVYLGLNKSYSELNLKNYRYYHYENINSMINVDKMTKPNHHTWEVYVPNVVNKSASPEGTTIVVLKTTYYSDIFSKVNNRNYNEIKENLASNLIEDFENTFNIDIKEYIEEIAIATPFTVEKYTNRINGSLMGYMRYGYDNSINRLLSYEEELIPNISFVGTSSIFGGGVDNAIYSGYYITNYLLNKKDDNKLDNLRTEWQNIKEEN